MAGSLKIVQFYDKEMGTVEDLGAIAIQSVANMVSFHTLVHGIIIGQGIQVISGLRVEGQGTPGPTVRLRLGAGVDQINLNLLEVLADQTINIISGAENKAGGIWGTGVAADATNPRKTVIGIKASYLDTDPASRTYIDTTTKTTYNSTVNTRKQNDYDIIVVHGAAAPAPVEPVLPAGYTKLAVITVPATANVISDANVTRTRPVVRNFAPGLTVQLTGDGAVTDTGFEVKSRAGATLFSVKDDGTVSLTAVYDAKYVLLSDKGANSGVATLTATGKLVQDAQTVAGKTPGTAAGNLVYSDGTNKLAYSITGDAATVAGKAPGTAAGNLVYSDGTNKLAYSITGDAATVAGKVPGAAAGNLVVLDGTGKVPFSITGDAATVAGKVPGTAAGNLVYSDVNNKLAYSITGDAATVAGKVPGAAAGNLAILDANLRVGDAAKLLGYVPNTGTVAGTIPVRDVNGNIAGSVVGDATTVGGKAPGTAAGNLVYSDVNNKLAYSITGDAATVAGYAPDATATANKIALRDAQGKLPGDILGNAAGATKWTTGRTITLTGDVGGTSGAFDGSADLSFQVSLGASGAAAGTYTKVTVDTKGRVTAGATATAADVGALATGEVVAAATANKLLRLDATSKLPADITGDAATVGGLNPSAFARVAGQGFTGRVTVDGGGGIFGLFPGTIDHTFMEFYARSATPGTRSGYMGFSSSATLNLSMVNQITNGDITFVTTGTGAVKINGSQAATSDANGRVADSVKLMGFGVTTAGGGQFNSVAVTDGNGGVGNANNLYVGAGVYAGTTAPGGSQANRIAQTDANGRVGDSIRVGGVWVRNNAGTAEWSADNVTWNPFGLNAAQVRTIARRN